MWNVRDNSILRVGGRMDPPEAPPCTLSGHQSRQRDQQIAIREIGHLPPSKNLVTFHAYWGPVPGAEGHQDWPLGGGVDVGYAAQRSSVSQAAGRGLWAPASDPGW